MFRNQFLRLVGRTFSEEEFEELCFEVGLELDDVTSEVRKSSPFVVGGEERAPLLTCL